MWPFKPEKYRYEAVATEDGVSKSVSEMEQQIDEQNEHITNRNRTKRCAAVAVCLAVLISVLGIGLLVYLKLSSNLEDWKESTKSSMQGSSTKNKYPLRKEWRDLSRAEQQDYISAVLCLTETPSALSSKWNMTAYDDFSWIHSRIGYFTHGSAPFLPWHRYFLHLYETTLRAKCGYEGSLVYWDWTLDWDKLEDSPVFNSETGFGGDGEVGGELTVSMTGRCVVDGPFAGIVAEYYDVKHQPHCLSRGFRDLEGNLGHMDGHDIRPESVEEVLSLPDYESFVTKMESRVHDAIPYGISGDFETFTAPYDPLFFLHHTQLDRLWWLWQQRQPDLGLEAYGGHKERHSIEMASLDDEINMGPLASNVKVREMMNIHSEKLQYDYR